MHAFCEIVYNTKIHSVTSYCFKVFFIDDVALVCKCLGMFKACLTYNLVESEHTVRNLDFFMNISTALTFEMHYRVYHPADTGHGTPTRQSLQTRADLSLCYPLVCVVIITFLLCKFSTMLVLCDHTLSSWKMRPESTAAIPKGITNGFNEMVTQMYSQTRWPPQLLISFLSFFSHTQTCLN